MKDVNTNIYQQQLFMQQQRQPTTTGDDGILVGNVNYSTVVNTNGTSDQQVTKPRDRHCRQK